MALRRRFSDSGRSAPVVMLPAPDAGAAAAASVAGAQAAGSASSIQPLYYLFEAIEREKQNIQTVRSAALATFLASFAPSAPDAPLNVTALIAAHAAWQRRDDDLAKQADALEKVSALVDAALEVLRRTNKAEVIAFLTARIAELTQKAAEAGKPYDDLRLAFQRQLDRLTDTGGTKRAAVPAKAPAAAKAAPAKAAKKTAPRKAAAKAPAKAAPAKAAPEPKAAV